MGPYICAGFILIALGGIVILNIRYNKHRAQLGDAEKRAEDDEFHRDTQLW